MQTFITPPSEDKTIASEGFSLLEILIALFIGTLILGLGLGIRFDSSDRTQLEETMEILERAVRFGVDEAVLRNRVIRLHFFLGKYPQEFTLEYAADENFVLSKKIKDGDEEDEGEAAQEERRELWEKINQQFQPVEEFREENQSLPERVRIFGVGTTAFERLIGGFEVSFFIYPSGEKDGALIILGTEDEMGTLGIEEFTMDFQRNWIENPENIAEDDGEDEEEEEIPTPGQWRKSKELFEKWLST